MSNSISSSYGMRWDNNCYMIITSWISKKIEILKNFKNKTSWYWVNLFKFQEKIARQSTSSNEEEYDHRNIYFTLLDKRNLLQQKSTCFKNRSQSIFLLPWSPKFPRSSFTVSCVSTATWIIKSTWDWFIPTVNRWNFRTTTNGIPPTGKLHVKVVNLGNIFQRIFPKHTHLMPRRPFLPWPVPVGLSGTHRPARQTPSAGSLGRFRRSAFCRTTSWTAHNTYATATNCFVIEMVVLFLDLM